MKIRLSNTVSARLARLHPDIKRILRVGLDDLLADPEIGKPLHDELAGWWSHRVHKYRIIYRIRGREIEVAEIGPRATIYVEMLKLLRGKRG